MKFQIAFLLSKMCFSIQGTIEEFSRVLASILLVTMVSCAAENETDPALMTAYSNDEIDDQVEGLLSQMTLAEKLAQIEGIRPKDIMVDGKFSIEKCRELIPHGIGHFCQFSSGLAMSPEELRDFVRQVQNYLMNETKLGLPAIFHEEAITGFATQGATTFPQQIGMGCTWNPELISRNTSSTARIMRQAGATYALSPMLDLSRTAHWGRIEESYGEDAYLTSALGLAFVSGLQGDSFEKGVAATTKHFAGYGSQSEDEKSFYEDFLRPHEVVIKLGNVKSVMPSYGKFKGTAVAASEEMLTEILREKVGFDGVVVSDYGAINLLYSGHKQADSPMDAGVKALKAGIDVELASPKCYPLLAEALDQHLVDHETVDAAVRRLLIMKAKLGLLKPDPEIGIDGDLDFDPPEHRLLAYESASQSIVLLKNERVLPLQEEIKKIALVGPNANTVHGLLGDYTYQSMISFWWGRKFDPNNPKLVTLEEGLRSKLNESVHLATERGCDWSEPLESTISTDLGDDRLSKVKMITIDGLPQPDLQKALDISEDSDVIIAAMGENIYLCGEGRERKGIRLPGEQEEFVKKLIATGKPVILVLFGGRPQVIDEIENGCAAIIQAWFPGEEGGNALADILLGRINPSGKLCLTYPKSEHKQELTYKDADKIKGSWMYPFGFGMSYTTYAYENIEIAESYSIAEERIDLSCDIKNSGNREGTEIVQLYVSPVDPSSSLNSIQLIGFQRVELKPGEQKRIQFEVSPEQFAQYKNGQWVIEPERLEFKLGASSSDIRLRKTMNLTGERKILSAGRTVFFSSNG